MPNFRQHTRSGDKHVQWGRFEPGGTPPFRGETAPLLRQHEYDSSTERVDECNFGTFDTSQPEMQQMGRTYKWVLDHIRLGWLQLLYREHMPGTDEDGNPKMYVYIEWSEPYDEVTPEAAARLGIPLEGSTNGSSSSKPGNTGGKTPPILDA